MSKLKVAVIVGSNRRASINRKLAEALVRLAGDRMEAHFVRIDDDGVDMHVVNSRFGALSVEHGRFGQSFHGPSPGLWVTPG